MLRIPIDEIVFCHTHKQFSHMSYTNRSLNTNIQLFNYFLLQKMDEENQINDKLEIKRKLNNVCVKKFRKKKYTKSQQLNSSMKDDPTKEMQTSKLKKIMPNEREQQQRNVLEGFMRRNVLMS